MISTSISNTQSKSRKETYRLTGASLELPEPQAKPPALYRVQRDSWREEVRASQPASWDPPRWDAHLRCAAPVAPVESLVRLLARPSRYAIRSPVDFCLPCSLQRLRPELRRPA